MGVDRLVTTAAALEAVGPVSLSVPVRGRLQRVAQACAQVRHALGHHHGPDVFMAPQGASAQKGRLRFTGAVLGGMMGVVTCLSMFPHVDSLGGFWIPFSAGTVVAAYVNFESPRLSYCGYQIGLAFYKVVLQGYGPVTELRVARNRLVGIALGLVVFGIIETQLWPVRAGATLRPTLATALRLWPAWRASPASPWSQPGPSETPTTCVSRSTRPSTPSDNGSRQRSLSRARRITTSLTS